MPRGKYYSWINSATSIQRPVQPEARLKSSTSAPRLKASPFLPGSSSLVGQTSSEFSRAKEEYRAAFHRARDARDLCSHPGPLQPRRIPTLPFSIDSKGKRAFLTQEYKRTLQGFFFPSSSVRSAISKFLPGYSRPGIYATKIGLGEQIGARLKSKSFPKSATTSTHPG